MKNDKLTEYSSSVILGLVDYVLYNEVRLNQTHLASVNYGRSIHQIWAGRFGIKFYFDLILEEFVTVNVLNLKLVPSFLQL